MAETLETSSNRSRLAWGIAVVAVVALALFLRVYWNVDAAIEPDGGFRLASGSDPYYHKRAIDHIQTHGWTTLIHDPLLNYPYGSVNPNPPLFEWGVAAAGYAMQPFFGGDLETATWWALLWSPAIMGALTTIPIYALGKELFGRRAGFLAALFWALSTASMDHTSLGASDHDAFYLFFLVLGFTFYVKSIHAVRGDPNWVERWSDGASVGAGLSALFRERRLALGYAVLAGISLAAVALTWKGFPYATGIVFAYAGIQLIVDHWRNRDSTGLFVSTLVVLALPVLVALPYYQAATVLSFLKPAAYLAFGFLVAGLVLVPTRDMPSILVLPVAALVALLGVAITFVLPALESVRTQLLYATVYFRQSRLYTTIAEAHPASFSDVVFSVGPIVFFCALLGLAGLLFTARKYPRRDTLFTFVWGVLAIYMAQSAVRFMFNAVPVLVVLAGWVIGVALGWLDYGALFRSGEGDRWAGLRRGFSTWHAVGAVLIAVFLLVPSVLLAVDAAIPSEVESEIVEEKGAESFLGSFVDKRMGAYTQGFLPDYWAEGLEWLDQHDAGVPPEDRGAFLAWWDYGHWAIAIGNHPASADNFQNGYVHAGNFLAAQNETHAVQLLAGRSLERDLVDATTAKSLLSQAGVSDVDTAYVQMKTYAYAPGVDLDKAAEFLDLVEKHCESIGRACKIRYVAVDVRMLEYDSPQTPNVDKQGIFYAPLYLAEKDVPSYFETRYTGSDGRDYSLEEAEARVKSAAVGPTGASSFQVTGEHYVFRKAYFDSMFWRAYAGIPPRGEGPTWRGDALEEGLDAPQPGFALEHFRLVYINDGLRILEYYPGAKVSGVVTEEGRPIEGAFVSVLDDSGDLTYPVAGPQTKSVVDDPSALDAPHTRTSTDENGRFTLTAPFSMTRGNTVAVIVDGVEVARQTLNVTREQAQGADLGEVVKIDIQPGRVTGTAFFDTDGDGDFNVTTEEVAANVTFQIGQQNVTTGLDGRYALEDVPAGTRTVTSLEAEYQTSTRSVRVRPGETTTFDVGLELRQAAASGRFFLDTDGDGEAAPHEGLRFFRFSFSPDAAVGGNTAREASGSTTSDGNWTAALTPGSYVLNTTYTAPDGQVYAVDDHFTVPWGATTFARDFLFTRK